MASQRHDAEVPAVASVKESNGPQDTDPERVVGAKRCRFFLGEDDPYKLVKKREGEGHTAGEERLQKALRFSESMAVAAQRMSIGNRTLASPSLFSPWQSRVARSSFLQNVSSGYDSMEDSFSDVTHIDSSEDASQLPSNIASLLRGIIFVDQTYQEDASSENVSPKSSNDGLSNPTTPDLFPGSRSNNYRESFSCRDERSEVARRSSLSKVRTRLFCSPDVSPSTSPVSNHGSATGSETSMSTICRRELATDFADEEANSCGVPQSTESPQSSTPVQRKDALVSEGRKLVKISRISNTYNTVDGKTVISVACTSRPVLLKRTLSAVTTGATNAVGNLTTSLMNVTLETNMGVEEDTALDSDIYSHINYAIHYSTIDVHLIGDFSKPCILPVVAGNHEDLKSISATTLASLIRGEFNDRIGIFQIVDCRYPYEFDAGHIQGAGNLYSEDLIKRTFLDPLISTPQIQPDSAKRNILVFHCEFSVKRGPNLLRYLRKLDRERNIMNYPALFYPEIYLLKGGYHRFYTEHKDLCIPQGYCPMKHPNYYAALRQFRCKSKSWQGETSRIATGSLTPTTIKRLDF